MWRDGRPEYFDICHPGKGQPHKDIVLWIHDGARIESKSAKFGKEHNDFWGGASHSADGRVDTAKKVGELAFAPGVDDRLARGIAEDVIAAFPSVKFWVFRGSDWGVPMQEFWESVA